MGSIVKEDLLYVDQKLYRFSSTKKEGFYTFSEIFHINFGYDYACTVTRHIYPIGEARRVNYTQLTSILRSKDESVYTKDKWIFDGHHRLLDKTESLMDDHQNHIMFTSFPRSGNSFMRRYLEQITGIATGCTMTESTWLQMMGLKGEGYCDDNIWVCKSHHPLLMPVKAPVFTANKTFICVRNPLDVFPSYAAYLNTCNHQTKPAFEIHELYPEWWAWWVRKQTTMMKDFFKIINNDLITNGKNPVYFVRYEDLLSAPKDTLMGLMSYMLSVPDIKGTNAERQIDSILEQGQRNKVTGNVYALKSTTGLMRQHENKYPAPLRQFVQEELADMIHYFGYAQTASGDNPTGFFEYDEDNYSGRNGFREDSQKFHEIVCARAGSKEKRPTYATASGDTMPVIDAFDMANL